MNMPTTPEEALADGYVLWRPPGSPTSAIPVYRSNGKYSGNHNVFYGKGDSIVCFEVPGDEPILGEPGMVPAFWKARVLSALSRRLGQMEDE